MSDNSPVLGIIGGSGLYQFPGLTDTAQVEVETPFGAPSAPLITGTLAGKRVVFLARHGLGHTLTPTEVNYRANIYALKSLGVRRVLGVSAVGSLREDYAPGHLIVPDQLIDFTRKRANSFFGEGLVAHVGVPDPFCPDFSELAYQAISSTDAMTHLGGTLVTIEGPRFSTRAESHLFRSWGVSLIGMTACPEAFLAREAGLCYATIAHVTDYDVWHQSEEPVSVEMVIQTLHRSLHIVQEAILSLLESLDAEPTCGCESSLEKALITNPSHIPPETRQRLALLVGKYLEP